MKVDVFDVQREMDELGITQNDLANESGLSFQRVSEALNLKFRMRPQTRQLRLGRIFIALSNIKLSKKQGLKEEVDNIPIKLTIDKIRHDIKRQRQGVRINTIQEAASMGDMPPLKAKDYLLIRNIIAITLEFMELERDRRPIPSYRQYLLRFADYIKAITNETFRHHSKYN